MEKLLTDKAKEIVEAIKVATNGTYHSKNVWTTLMGWIDEYDSKGRLVTADPNWRDSEIIINHKIYHITRHKWMIYIWKPEYSEIASYTRLLGVQRQNKVEDVMIAIIDTESDYVKEYWKQKKNNK